MGKVHKIANNLGGQLNRIQNNYMLKNPMGIFHNQRLNYISFKIYDLLHKTNFS